MKSNNKTKTAHTRIVTRHTIIFPTIGAWCAAFQSLLAMIMLHVVVTMKNRFTFYDVMHLLAHFIAQIPVTHTHTLALAHKSALTYLIGNVCAHGNDTVRETNYTCELKIQIMCNVTLRRSTIVARME